ncbi:MAG: hypothetical protein PHW04_03580 [Candidatus Wallbacteria bacterium]|nr:hypothetical protein [Candidatus Wallbacteria bacterium]
MKKLSPLRPLLKNLRPLQLRLEIRLGRRLQYLNEDPPFIDTMQKLLVMISQDFQLEIQITVLTDKFDLGEYEYLVYFSDTPTTWKKRKGNGIYYYRLSALIEKLSTQCEKILLPYCRWL